MESQLRFEILHQPNATSCGPTCLHSVYRFFGDHLELEDVIREVPSVQGGGTYAVHLAMHALQRGYPVRIYTYNLQVFDPTWFRQPDVDLAERLAKRGAYVASEDLKRACAAYSEFLRLGGEIRWRDLTPSLIRKYINRGLPILTGLSATYLYQSAREFGFEDDYDDIRGEPSGHFVVLCGYSRDERNVLIADPYNFNPSVGQIYSANIDRVLCSILLGVLTYDANLVIIQPPKSHADEGTAARAVDRTGRRQP